MPSKQEEFIAKAKAIHGDQYSYENVTYVKARKKVSIVCPIHGAFLQQPYSHVEMKRGCFRCSVEFRNKGLRSTTGDFINKAKTIHGDRYDYNKVVYMNSASPVVIQCEKHGDFHQRPNSHLLGQGCARCGGKVQLTTEEFIINARAMHGDKYDYSQTHYVTAKVPVKIICSKHGVFEQIPNNHTNGSGCYSCMSRIVDTTQYLEKVKAVHGDLYDYSKVVYNDGATYITIGCKIHGDFQQTAAEHLRGRGCRKCSQEYLGTVQPTTEEFITRAKAVHGEKYDYSQATYVNSYTRVKIICSKHDLFKQTPGNHLKGSGCHTCSSSKGEMAIAKILKKHNIEFLQEHSINNCNSRFRYDFYVPSLNLLIEYHGIQHYHPVDYFGGQAGLLATRIRDEMKKLLAKAWKYKFLEVNYTQFLNLSQEDFEKKLLRNIEMLKPISRKGKSDLNLYT